MSSAESRIAVVVNGNAKSVNAEVISTLDQILRGGDLFVSRHIDEAPEIAKTLVHRGYGTVLTGGGDGTFTVMVTEVSKAAKLAGKSPPRFGLLKLGTGNALAWVVGASPLGDKNASADIERLSREAGSKPIYLVDVEGYRTPFAGIGADALILADYNSTKAQLAGTPLAPLGRGLSGYGVAAVTKSLPKILVQKMPVIRAYSTGAEAWPIGPEGRTSPTPIEAGSLLYEGPARMAALSTIPYYGFGMKLFPFADASSGFINLRISRVGSPQFLGNVRGIWNGTYYDPRYLTDFLVKGVRIECEPAQNFQIGGDSQGVRTSIEAHVTPEPIQLVDYYVGRSR